jgi:hypothetical protein
MRTLKHLGAAAAVVAAASSCGDVVRTGRAPVMLIMNSLQAEPTGGFGANILGGVLHSDVIVMRTAPAPCTPQAPCPTFYSDSGQAVLSIALKDVGTTANPTVPTTNNQVTITRVHIKYTRADGRNVQGVDVPYEFDGAVTGTVPINGTLTLGFEIVRHAAKEEPPLVGLQVSSSIITTIAEVTFYGKDAVGNDVSVTGQIQIDFGNFGDA